MIPKPINNVAAADIDDLVRNKVPETRTIEYKRELPGSTDSDKREFLADVSSFANTAGGDLLFGVAEMEGLPTKVIGVQSADLDAEISRLDSIIRSGLDPRIRSSVRSINCNNGSVVLIRIEESWFGPHRVIFRGHDKFYARHSTGKYPLDVSELRQAFLQTSATAEKIAAFRESRLIDISRGRTPVPVSNDDAKIVLHLVPRESFGAPRVLDINRDIPRYVSKLPPMGNRGWSHRVTLEGLLTFSPPREGESSSYEYTHLYRTGIIEAIEVGLLNRGPRERRSIPSMIFEKRVLESTHRYLTVLRDLDVAPPIYVYLSLLGVKGCYMRVNMQSIDDSEPIDREVLQFPAAVFSADEDDTQVLMRSTIDLVWNACGHIGSPNYDSKGHWDPENSNH